MKVLFFLILFFISYIGHTQCYELVDHSLENIGDIPYAMVDKFVFDVKSGKSVIIKIRNVEYKSKLGFLLLSNNLGDTIDVSLLTLNRKVLTRKRITNSDYFLRYEPFRKSENYFLSIQTKTLLDSNKRVLSGCLAVVVLERVKKKAFVPLQKIKWEIQKN